MSLDHEVKYPHRGNYFGDDTGARINSTKVRQISSEVTPLGREKAKSNTESISGEVDPLVSDYAAGGVISQETGELSYALGIVDKLLLDNDMGSSQEKYPGKTEVVKSPLVLSVKGVQSLAIKADHKKSFERTEIYNWPDSHEYKGTGGQRKRVYLENQGVELGSHSCLGKLWHHSSTVITGPVDKSGGKEGVNINICQKVKCSAHWDSIHSENSNISEMKTRNIYKDMDEEPNSKSVIQNFDLDNVVEDADLMYNAGPDTQMAAEAMESLLHGSPANHEVTEDAPSVAENLTEYSRRSVTMTRPFFNASLQKSISSSRDSKGIAIPSKREKANRGGPRTSGEQGSSSTLRKKREKEKIKVKKENQKLNRHSRVRDSINTSEFTVPSKQKKVGETVTDTFAGEIQYTKSMMINGQLSVSKEPIHYEHVINATPVAHRTRHSKSRLTSKLSESPSCIYRKPINEQLEERNPGVRIGEDKLAAGIHVTLRPRRKGHLQILNPFSKSGRNIPSHSKMQIILGHQKAEPKTSSLTVDAFTHPKRRRTHHYTREDLSNANLKSSSISGVLSATMLTRRRKIEASDRTLPEVLDGAKQRKRSVSTCLPSEIGGIPCNTREKPEESFVDTRLPLNSPSYKPHSENDSKLFLTKPFYECGSNNGNNSVVTPLNNRVPLKEVTLSNQATDSVSHVEDVEGNAKLDGSPKNKAQSFGLVCMTIKKTNTKSPSALDLGRTCNKSFVELSKSKDFTGLEAAESAFSWPLKESRRRKDLSSVRVLFSNNLKDDIIKKQKKILARLGVLTASSISEATHFVTDKFARTRNMLEAIAMGKPVVTHMWIESCGQASCFIDEKKYIMRDWKKEKEIGFSMPLSLARASQFSLLQGKRVFVTPNIKPDRELVASLVKVAHGQPMEELGSSAIKTNKVPDDLLVISCEEDFEVCRHLIEKGAEIFSSELLLNGIVIQKLEFNRHRLSFNHAASDAQ